MTLPNQVTTARATVHDLRAQRAALVDALRGAAPGDRLALLTQYRDLGEQIVAAAGAAFGVLGDDLTADASVPLTLLPVRAETRYSVDGAVLRIRVYPDDVHTMGLDDGVSDDERVAAEQYWTTRWVANDDPGATLWQTLTLAVGTTRAAWVAYALTPTNLAAFGQAAVAPIFPSVVPARHNLPAVALGLPDRFHVLARHPGGAVSRGVGLPVPDELVVSLPTVDPMVAVADDGQPVVDTSMRWMTDYATALATGMAVEVTLPTPFTVVESLLVIGVRSTLAPADGAALLERMLVGHRFADAAEFVAIGTPTNNTDSDRSGWSARTPAGPPDTTAPALGPWANAQVLGTALGLDATAIAVLPGADEQDSGFVHALHLLLWDSTWGEFLNRTAPLATVTPAVRAAIEDHYERRVRSRGPLPPLRVGNQPYGVLPVLDTAALVADASAIESTLAPFLQRLRLVWDLGVANVATMIAPADVDDALSEILGTAPVLQGVRLRTVASASSTAVLDPTPGENAVVQADAAQVGWSLTAIEHGVRPTNQDILGRADRTLALPLADDSDIAFIKALLEKRVAPTPASILQVLLAHATQYIDHDVSAYSSPDDLATLSGVALEQAAQHNQQLVGPVRAALAAVAQGTGTASARQSVLAAASTALSQADLRLDRTQLAAADPFPALSAATTTPLQRFTGGSPAPLQRDSMALRFVSEVIRLHQRRQLFDDALMTMLEPTTDERAELLAEVLDASSHRLDAWLTSIATYRLEQLRAVTPTGTAIGAYAWLDAITPAHPSAAQAARVDGVVLAEASVGGFVQTPSLDHAATAAILRSAQLSHGDTTQFAVDLESSRVREALTILDGVRQGQPLGALLGYRFERTLLSDDAPIARFIYALRPLAPLIDGKLSDPGAPTESVAANNVVDGVRLREISIATPAQIDAALTEGPQVLGSADGAYLITWDPPTTDERAAVWAAIAGLDDQYDGLADVLMAESVHQLVKGNPSRSAAALDALGGGEAVPPDPDVVRTPRSGVALTHRVGVLMPVGGDTVGWSTIAPRAVAEPALEAWVAAQLGAPPATAEKPGVNDAGLCALDVLYEADGDDYAATSLVRRLPGLDPVQWQLIRSLRTLVTGARPVTLAWLGRTVAAGDPPDLGGLDGRAVAARDSLFDAVSIGHAMDPSTALTDVLSQIEPFGLRAGPVLPIDPVAQQALVAGLLADGDRRVAHATELITAGRYADALTAVFGGGLPGPAGVRRSSRGPGE